MKISFSLRSVLLLLPLAAATPLPAPQATPENPIVTCYPAGDSRATSDLLITVLLGLLDDRTDTPQSHPWWYSNLDAWFRVAGDEFQTVGTSVALWKSWVTPECRPEDGGDWGGMVDFGVHRVRISYVGR